MSPECDTVTFVLVLQEQERIYGYIWYLTQQGGLRLTAVSCVTVVLDTTTGLFESSRRFGLGQQSANKETNHVNLLVAQEV